VGLSSIQNVDDVAPLMTPPFLFHSYKRGAVPVPVTLNVAVAGAVTVWLGGWVLIEGSPPRATIKPAARRRRSTIFITSMKGSW
jgi:hypothetical protein